MTSDRQNSAARAAKDTAALVDIGQAIRLARRNHRLTQEQLGELITVSTRTIRDIEHGSPSPSIGAVAAAAAAVGLSIGVTS